MNKDELAKAVWDASKTPGNRLLYEEMLAFDQEPYKKLARAVLTRLLDDPVMSRETRRYLEAILSEGTDNG